MLQPSQFPKLEIPYDKVLARLGYARGKTQLDGRTNDTIREELERARKLVAPRQVMASSKVSASGPEQITLEPHFVINSSKVYELLKECSQAYGFAVTIGPHLEQKRAEFIKEKETGRALILDAIGSVMAEELAEITNRQIKDTAAAEGLTTTMRFSPGYGDWKLSGQKDFLAWLSAGSVGITLAPSYQMLPEKSVSAILGLKKE